MSDALHERLTQRFVDRRSASLVRSLEGGGALLAAINREGAVLVEGQAVGRLDGFRFVPDAEARGEDGRALMSAARRALRDEMAARLRRLEADPDSALSLDQDGLMRWHGAEVGKLASGPTLLTPVPVPLHDALLDSGQRERVRRRLEARLESAFTGLAGPLHRLTSADLSGPARGIAFQLAESAGELPRLAVPELLAALGSLERRSLSALGVRFGTALLTMPALLKPAVVALRALLYAVHHGLSLPVPVPPPSRISIIPDTELPPAYYRAIGFPIAGPRAIRADILDRFETALKSGTPSGRLIGCSDAELPAVLTALGYRPVAAEDGTVRWRPHGPRRPRRRQPAVPAPVDAEHPFAKLRALEVGR